MVALPWPTRRAFTTAATTAEDDHRDFRGVAVVEATPVFVQNDEENPAIVAGSYTAQGPAAPEAVATAATGPNPVEEGDNAKTHYVKVMKFVSAYAGIRVNNNNAACGCA